MSSSAPTSLRSKPLVSLKCFSKFPIEFVIPSELPNYGKYTQKKHTLLNSRDLDLDLYN